MSAFWASFVAAALAAGPILAMLRAMKSRQTVSEFAPVTHKVKGGTPTMGGLIVLVGILFGLVFSWPSYGAGRTASICALLLLVGFAAIGFVDDWVVPRLVKGKRGLGWRQKILMQAVAATVGVLPLGLGLFGTLWAVFVVLFLSNAYNFADGLDGLAAGIGLAYCAGLYALSPAFHPVALSVAGGLAVFLFLNAHPAKIFMGDVGSLPIGALFGLVTVVMTTSIAGPDGPYTLVLSRELLLVAGALNLMLAAELIPVPIQILSVKIRGKRVFPCTPIHHAFERGGWPETRVTAAFTLVQLLASALAVTLVPR